MTRYLDSKPFTIPAWERPKDCDHSEPWTDKRGLCVKCGEPVPENSLLRESQKGVS